MERPGKEVLESLTRLKHDEVLMRWLQTNLTRFTRETVMQRDDISLRQAQGKAALLEELIGLIRYEPSHK